MKSVWVFNGPKAGFPSGIFSSLEQAESWIGRHCLTGTLTSYPVDQGVYDWAKSNGLFTPHTAKEATPEFVAAFTTASMSHYHYENGTRA